MSALKYVPPAIERRRGPKARLAEAKKIGVWFVGAKKSANFNWFQEQLIQTQHSNPRQRIDLSVLFSNSPDEIPRAIADREVDGVIVQGMEPSTECCTKLGDMPRVWFMTRRTLDYPGDYVEPNNELNGRMAADYLFSQGRKIVAVIAADPGYSAVAWRARAFLDRAKELGLATHSILGKPKPTSYLELAPLHEESDQLAKRLAQLGPRPSGLYVPVDHFCGSLFRSLRQVGIEPDRSCEVILGNYNPVIYHNLYYQPAALDINLPVLVSKVIDHLVWRIENPGMPGRVSITVAPTLVPSGGRKSGG